MELPKQSSLVLFYNQSDRKTLPWRHCPPSQPNAVNIPTDPKLSSSLPRDGSYPQNLLPHKFFKLFKCFLLSLLISLPLAQLSSSRSPCRVCGNVWPGRSWVCHPLDSQQIQQTGCAGFSSLAQAPRSLHQTNEGFCFSTEISPSTAVLSITTSSCSEADALN